MEIDNYSSASGSSEQTVNEDCPLNEPYDTVIEYKNERTTDADGVSNTIPQTLRKELPKTDRCILRYFINRQYGYNITHSSLYAVQGLHILHKLPGQGSTITALSFNSKGTYLVSGSNDDGTITVWDWQKGIQLTNRHCIDPEVQELQFHQLKWLPFDIECFVISSDTNGDICMLDIETGEVQELFSNPNNRHSLSTHKDFPLIILSADDDANILSIDVRTNKATKLLSAKDYYVQLFSIDTHPLNGNEFCIAGNMSCVNVYDRRVPATCLYQMYPEHMGINRFIFVDRVHYSRDGTEIVAAYGDEAVYLFNTINTKRKRTFTHRYSGLVNSAIKDVNFFGPNSDFIVSSSDNGRILMWDKKSEALERLIFGDKTVGDVQPHPLDPILATSNTHICIWTPYSKE